MFSQSEKDWILEAINHLKRRKARPDFSRISLRMKRKHHLTILQTRQLLDSLVESGIVIKAVYKNNTSYRDVSKWKKGKLGGQIQNSSRMLQRFVRAITAKQSPDRKYTGVSAKEIEEWLGHEKDDKCFLSGAALRDAIENEVANGYLKKLDVNNNTFYSVNVEKIDFDLDLDSPKTLKLKTSPTPTSTITTLAEKNNTVVSNSSAGDVAIELDENNLNVLRMGICGTEEKQGCGSSLWDIESWIKMNVLPSRSSLLTERRLFAMLEQQVKAGFIKETVVEGVTLYSMTDKTTGVEDIKPTTLELNAHGHGKTTSSHMSAISKPGGRAAETSLRPPSKRKRIQKNHGPDFEMELPTKSKSKSSASKELNFPTTLDSPVSEKSEANIENSFKFDPKKKRGRPKKPFVADEQNTGDSQDAIDAMGDNSSRQGGPSEQSSVCQDDDYDDRVSEPALPDVSTWTAQQVADYFMEQGYGEESKQMLENEVDGAALCLLRRSDIVGPPAEGMLKIKKLGVALKLFRDIRNLLYDGHADNYMDPYEERAFFRS